MDPLPSHIRTIRNRSMLFAIALLCLAYISDSSHISDIEKVIQRGELVVLTLPGATTYFEDGDDPDEMLELPPEIMVPITEMNQIHHSGCIIFESLAKHLKIHNYF